MDMLLMTLNDRHHPPLSRCKSSMLSSNKVSAASDDVNFDDWDISELELFPALPIAAPFSKDKKCREDSRNLIVNLKNKTYWAMKMWDSSAKTEFGVLYGNAYQGGNFDECLSIREPFETQYCGVTMRVEIYEEYLGGNSHDLDPSPYDVVWKKLKDSRVDPSKYPRDNTTRGLCVPASCSADEMLTSVKGQLDKFNLKFNGSMKYVAHMEEGHCQGQKEIKYSAGEIAFWSTTVALVLLVAASSSADFLVPKYRKVFKNHDGKRGEEGGEEDDKEKKVVESRAYKLFMSFSLRRNCYKLFEIENEETEHLKILYTSKYITIVFIIIAHRSAIFLSAPVLNYQAYEEQVLRSFQNMFMPHGDLLVDSFFFISGLIVGFLMLTLYHKKFVNPILIIFGRFIRFAPLYYFMVWFHASGLYRLGSGPVWPGLKIEVDYCQKNWWTNILFINNYVNVEEICMIHSWFIPCDFHLFIVTVFLVVLICKFEKIGVGFTVLLFLASGAAPGIITFFYRIVPVHLFYHANLGSNIRVGPLWKLLYTPTHARAAVYFIGFITGYIIYKTKDSKKRMPVLWAAVNILLCLALFFAPMVYGSFYYDPEKQYDVIESSIFASLRRLSWGLACFTFMMVTRFAKIPGLKLVEKLHFFFAPLSKVTYAVYLVHFYMISADRASVRIPSYFSFYKLFTAAASDVLIATIYGTGLYLMIELPFKIFVYELLFAKVVEKVKKEIEDKEKRVAEVMEVIAKARTEMTNAVSVKL